VVQDIASALDFLHNKGKRPPAGSSHSPGLACWVKGEDLSFTLVLGRTWRWAGVSHEGFALQLSDLVSADGWKARPTVLLGIINGLKVSRVASIPGLLGERSAIGPL
jgi:hypothetical protein